MFHVLAYLEDLGGVQKLCFLISELEVVNDIPVDDIDQGHLCVGGAFLDPINPILQGGGGV